MSLNKIWPCFLLSVLSVLFVSGCETVPLQKPLKIDANRVVVLHVESLHKELTNSAAPVYQQLIKSIQKKGFQVISLTDAVYQKMHEDALLVSGSVYDPQVGVFIPLDRSTYIKAIIDLSAKQFAHDIVLIPEMVLRTASVTGDKANWDDVSRELVFIDQPPTTYQLPRKVKGLSLRLGAYTYNGAEVFLNFSGISLPYQMRYFDKKISLNLKEQYFTDEELKEGINLALKPFFKQVTYKDAK